MVKPCVYITMCCGKTIFASHVSTAYMYFHLSKSKRIIRLTCKDQYILQYLKYFL